MTTFSVQSLSMKIGTIKEWAQLDQPIAFKGVELQPLQMAIINCNKEHDVLVCLPTGQGKHLLYQYPAAKLNDKFILVFQAYKRPALGDTEGLRIADCDEDFIEKYRSEEALPQILFLTGSAYFQNNKIMTFIHYLYKKNKIQEIVIDEAQWSNEWSFNYRLEYAQLSQLKSHFPRLRFLCIISIFPREGLKQLISNLQIVGCYYFQATLYRPNIFYEVQRVKKDDLGKKVFDYISSREYLQKSGIVYCQTVPAAQQLFKELTSLELECTIFHSRLEDSAKKESFDRFIKGETKCIVATTALGTGLDKKDIRYIINAGQSFSIENYYAQTNRAGKDGKVSCCLLLTFESDLVNLQKIICKIYDERGVKKWLFKLNQMKQYGRSEDCRKKMLFKELGEEIKVEECRKTCDFCNTDPNTTKIKYNQRDFTEQAFFFVSQLQKHTQCLTKMQLCYCLKGKYEFSKNRITKEKFIRIHQYMKGEKYDLIEKLVETLIIKGVLIEYVEQVKFGNRFRLVEMLKPCTKGDLMKHKESGIVVRVPINTNSHHPKQPALNMFLTKNYEKYGKSQLDDSFFELSKKKEETPEKEKVEVVESGSKDVNVVGIGADYEKFYDELFPQKPELQPEIPPHQPEDNEEGEPQSEKSFFVEAAHTQQLENHYFPQQFYLQETDEEIKPPKESKRRFAQKPTFLENTQNEVKSSMTDPSQLTVFGKEERKIEEDANKEKPVIRPKRSRMIYYK